MEGMGRRSCLTRWTDGEAMRRSPVCAAYVIGSVLCVLAVSGCATDGRQGGFKSSPTPSSVSTATAPAWAEVPVPWQRVTSTDASLNAALRSTSTRYLVALTTGDTRAFTALSAEDAKLARQQAAAFGAGAVPDVSGVSVSDEALFGNGVVSAAGNGGLWIARVTFREHGPSGDSTSSIGLVGSMPAPNSFIVTRVVRLGSDR